MVYFKHEIKCISQNLLVNTWYLDNSTRTGGEETSKRGSWCEDADY